MAAGGEDFDSWLSLKLLALNIDEGVFGSYIKGILDGDESLEDKTEALEGILSEITENGIRNHCREILEKWRNTSQAAISVKNAEVAGAEAMDVKLAKLMESQARPTTVQRTYTDEERRIREAILAQYSQMSDQDDDEDEGDRGAEGKENGLVKNTNASVVQQAEKEKREKAKLESQKKKEKDREDREKQKQIQQEKKEKRKTQKGERRR